jgi:GxxExxY protein
MPLIFEDVYLDCGLVDLLVEKKLIIELKSVDSWDIHLAQTLTYWVKLGNTTRDFINFNEILLKTESEGRYFNL